jgi:hypothetical protein
MSKVFCPQGRSFYRDWLSQPLVAPENIYESSVAWGRLMDHAGNCDDCREYIHTEPIPFGCDVRSPQIMGVSTVDDLSAAADKRSANDY